MTTEPYVITEISAEQAWLASSIVQGLPDGPAIQKRWGQLSPHLSPTDLLLLWNEAQRDVLQVAGPAILLIRLKLLSNKKVQMECRSLSQSVGDARRTAVSLN